MKDSPIKDIQKNEPRVYSTPSPKYTLSDTYIYMSIYTLIYNIKRAYICVYIHAYTDTHQHTQTHIYIFIYLYMCACVHVCMYVCMNKVNCISVDMYMHLCIFFEDVSASACVNKNRNYIMYKEITNKSNKYTSNRKSEKARTAK